jgi:hypothetical protein
MEQIGIEFNNFMAYIRSNFGKVSCCRVFESFQNGYLHIHCILLFQEYTSRFSEILRVNSERMKKALSLKADTAILTISYEFSKITFNHST